jgi:solute carrier family 25 (mitochondrial carnitine/acylcarnitine transporter), member 20/29
MQTEYFGLSVQDSIKQVYRTSGLSGFYKGFAAPFMAQGLYKAVIFGTNSYISNKLTMSNSSVASFLSGMAAGAVNALIVSPVELIRNQQLLKKSKQSHTTVSQCLRNIISQNGYLGLYRGLTMTIARDGTGLGIYFLTYKLLRERLEDSIPSRLLAGSCAGIMFWAAVLPLDTLKSMIQSAELSTQPRLSHIVKSLQLMSGAGIVRRLYVSWPIALARGVPGAAITLTTYDIASQKIRELRVRPEERTL